MLKGSSGLVSLSVSLFIASMTSVSSSVSAGLTGTN
jgi:hypothetical protein